MIKRQAGVVTQITQVSETLLELVVEVNNKQEKAYAFPSLTGEIRTGDRVILNTTAVELGLGSGGYHYVMGNLTSDTSRDINSLGKTPGHIMKLRYTPLQLRVLSVEEPESPYHDLMNTAQGLGGIPVIVGSLHSMLIPCVCGIKAVVENIRVVYVMTDGGALPLRLSGAVQSLQEKGLLSGTITVGHSFGGDWEAVNIYSGLLAAREVLKAQVIVILMGPGVVGTNTPWGTTALEIGQVINAVSTLNGTSYTIPRISFAEGRGRHRGISHHTVTALEKVALASSKVVLPQMEPEQKKTLQNQLMGGIAGKHQLIWGEGTRGVHLARELGLHMKSMGRSFEDDPIFFLAAAAAGEEAASFLCDNGQYLNVDGP